MHVVNKRVDDISPRGTAKVGMMINMKINPCLGASVVEHREAECILYLIPLQ